MSLRKYANYKDSGIAWLGKVPAHWELKKLKYVCLRSGLYGANVAATHYRETGVRFLRTTDITDDGQIKKDGVFLPEELVRDYILNDGDILLSRSGTVGRSLLYQSKLHGPCAYAGYLVRFVPNPHTLPRYVFFFTKTHAFERFLRLMAISATIENVNADKYANAHLPAPPLEEQQKIAAFLDKETAQIDALIDEQTRLISLLREKRQAVISNAITKGLNPNATMKDSGIEWIGKVPAHWEVKRIKHVAQLNPSKSELKAMPPDTLVTFLPMECIGETGQLDVRNSKPLSDVISGYTYLAENDVISAKITPCFENGKGAVATGLLNDIAFATTEVVPFRCIGIHNRYLYFLFLSFPFRKIAEGSMYGAAGQKRVSETFFANYKCCIPPTQAEQEEIADYLDRETKQIDALIEECEMAIGLLKERRTALISAAVTGAIDVRNVG